MKFCIDCKWYDLYSEGRWLYEKRCCRPGLRNVINGEGVTCYTERYFNNVYGFKSVDVVTGHTTPNYSNENDYCGIEGKYYEPKVLEKSRNL